MTALDGINVETFGTGPRRVVALHCALGRGATWSALSRHLEEATITAPDWPSHGKSAPWTRDELMLETAIAIAAECIGNEPVDLVGHSYGALVALHLATERPELVKSLTLIEPIFLVACAHDAPEVLDTYLADMLPHFESLMAGDTETAAREFIGMWGGGAPWEQIPEPVRAGLVAQIPVITACRPGDYNSAKDEEALARLEQLRLPVLLVHGDRTVEIIKVIMQSLARRLPQSESAVIEKAGHMVANTHAQDIADLLTRFWSEQETDLVSPLC